MWYKYNPDSGEGYAFLESENHLDGYFSTKHLAVSHWLTPYMDQFIEQQEIMSAAEKKIATLRSEMLKASMLLTILSKPEVFHVSSDIWESTYATLLDFGEYLEYESSNGQFTAGVYTDVYDYDGKKFYVTVDDKGPLGNKILDMYYIVK